MVGRQVERGRSAILHDFELNHSGEPGAGIRGRSQAHEREPKTRLVGDSCLFCILHTSTYLLLPLPRVDK